MRQCRSVVGWPLPVLTPPACPAIPCNTVPALAMGFKRTHGAVLLALACVVATQQKCVLGFSVSFLAATARSRTTTSTRALHHRLDLLQDTSPSASASKELPPLSRSQLLRLIPPGVFGAVVFGAAAEPSFSALPTTEDYAFGTGSKVRKRAAH